MAQRYRQQAEKSHLVGPAIGYAKEASLGFRVYRNGPPLWEPLDCVGHCVAFLPWLDHGGMLARYDRSRRDPLIVSPARN